jgi:tyrosyl-DNA phosphodiesterase 2
MHVRKKAHEYLFYGIAVLVFLICLPTDDAIAKRKKGIQPGIKLLTYNVYGFQLKKTKRFQRLMRIIYHSDADVVALQEVSSSFLKNLLGKRWVRKRYYGILFPSRKTPHGGLYTLSKYPIVKYHYVYLPSKKNRRALLTYIRIRSTPIAIANVHLESKLRDNYLRAKQLQIIFEILKNAENAVILGDFNFGEGEQPESSYLDHRYVDLWRSLRYDSPGYTWNMRKNWLAWRNAFRGERSRRIDRILIKSKRWRPQDIRIVGTKPIRYRVKKWYRVKRRNKYRWRYRMKYRYLFPSDHYGLVGTLTKKTQMHISSAALLHER